MFSCCRVLHLTLVALTSLVWVTSLLAYVIYSGLALYYSASALHHGRSYCSSLTSFNWLWLVCFISVLSFCIVFVQLFTMSWKNLITNDIMLLVSMVLVWSSTVGTESALNVAPLCHGDARTALVAYGIGSLVTGGSVLLLALLIWCTEKVSNYCDNDGHSVIPDASCTIPLV